MGRWCDISQKQQARIGESEFSATAYDRACRSAAGDLLQSLPDKVVSPGEAVGIRGDAGWNVPEPELALVINSSGQIVGFTIGNDMTRDIEGENLLYGRRSLGLVRRGSVDCRWARRRRCAAVEHSPRDPAWRGLVFVGDTRAGQIKRRFSELIECLFRSQRFPNGAVLLTGAGVVPPDSFTLEARDSVRISISGIGTLENRVAVV